MIILFINKVKFVVVEDARGDDIVTLIIIDIMRKSNLSQVARCHVHIHLLNFSKLSFIIGLRIWVFDISISVMIVDWDTFLVLYLLLLLYWLLELKRFISLTLCIDFSLLLWVHLIFFHSSCVVIFLMSNSFLANGYQIRWLRTRKSTWGHCVVCGCIHHLKKLSLH